MSPNDTVWTMQQYPTIGTTNGTSIATNYSGYFVANSGSDANSGLSPTEALKTIGYALSNSTPGSVIQLVSGDTFGPYPYALTFQHSNTITTYGAGPAIIAWTNGNGLTISNLSNIAINNITLIGTNANNGIAFYDYVAGISNLNVLNCNISGCGQNPVLLPSGIESGFGILLNAGINGSDWNTTISNCVVHDCYTDGFISWADNNSFPYCHTNVYVLSCTFSNIFGDGNLNEATGIPIAIGMATNSVASFNVLHDYGMQTTDSTGGSGGIVAVFSTVGLYEDNSVYNGYATPLGVDGVGIDPDISSSRIMVMYNSISNCAGAGLLEYHSLGTNVYAFNSIVNCDTDGNTASIYKNGTGTGDIIANNTVQSPNQSFAEEVSSPGTNTLANNIFYQYTSDATLNVDLASGTNWLLASNLFYTVGATFHGYIKTTAYNSFASFLTRYPHAGSSLNPLFYNSILGLPVTNQIPWSNSPALAYGVPLNSLGLSIPSDILGNATPSTAINAGAISANLTAGCSPLYTNIYAYWGLTEGSGATAYDISGFGHDLDLVGSPAWTSGVLGGGLTFNGTTQGASDGGFAQTPPLTLAAWVNESTTSGAQTIMAAWDDNESYLMENTGCYIVNSAGEAWFVAYSLGTGTHRIVVTYDNNSTMVAYIDGIQVATGAADFATSPGLPTMTMGYDTESDPEDYFHGSIYQAVIWGMALTSSQVSLDYNSGAGRIYPFQ